MEQDGCFTILGYDENEWITTGTIYFYETLPFNTNPSGKMGGITNIWTVPKDRKQRIVRSVIERILELAKNRWDMVCLKAVIEAKGCIKE